MVTRTDRQAYSRVRIDHPGFDDFDDLDLQPQWREMFESLFSVELPHPPDSPFAKDSDENVDEDNETWWKVEMSNMIWSKPDRQSSTSNCGILLNLCDS